MAYISFWSVLIMLGESPWKQRKSVGC